MDDDANDDKVDEETGESCKNTDERWEDNDDDAVI
jgi:hypothetical protein